MADEPTNAERNGSENDVAGELHRLNEQIGALQGEVRRLAGGPLPAVPREEGPAEAPSYAWVGSLEPRLRRRPALPRFLLEAAFLVAAAALAAAADFEPYVIALVMVGAWVIVALAEWAASRAERRREEMLMAPPPVLAAPPEADPAWLSPPVEHTQVEHAADSETAVTRLPPVSDEATVEHSAPSGE